MKRSLQAATALLPLLLSACSDMSGLSMPWEEAKPRHQNQPSSTAANIEPGESVQVQVGDTVYSIARRYQVPMRDVITLNNLKSPFTLVPGSNITLPAKEIMMVGHSSPPGMMPPPAAAPAMIVQQEKIPDIITPTGPEKIIGQPIMQEPLQPPPLTKKYAKATPVMSPPRPVEAPPIAPPPVAQTAPAPIVPPPQIAQAAPTPTPVRVPPPQVAQVQPPSQPPVQLAATPPAPPPPPVPTETASKKAPEQPDQHFIWPVHGTVISDFGSKNGGLKNDGINIAVPRGTPVAAADGGTVAYAGSDIPGYGNVVLIRHPDGYMTTYAHLERIFVDKDNVAAKGDVIGTVGTTGGLVTPQLHFEIRRGAEAVKPEKYLTTKAM